MKDAIFDYYFLVATPTILGGFALIGLGMLIWPVGNRWKDSLLALLIYLALVALGMSANIKHLSPVGLAHAAIAFWLAWFAISYYKNRVSYLFLVPCLFIAVVMLFNVASEERGLELMGRWTATPAVSGESR